MGSTDQLFLNAEFLQDLCVLIEPDFQKSDAMFITAKNQFPLSNLGVRNELVSLSFVRGYQFGILWKGHNSDNDFSPFCLFWKIEVYFALPLI